MIVRIPADVYADLATLALARVAGKKRFDGYSEWSQEMAKRGKGDSTHGHVVGLLGEYAAAQALGAAVDTRIFDDDGDNNVGDIFAPGIGHVQVKTRTRRGWDFALGSDNPGELLAPLAVLVWPGSTVTEAALSDFSGHALAVLGAEGGITMEVWGWITQEEFRRFSQKVDYGLGARLMVSPHWFHKILNPAMARKDIMFREGE